MKKSSLNLIYIALTMLLGSMTVLTSSRLSSLQRFQKASNGFDVRGIVLSTSDENNITEDGPILTFQDVFWFGFGFAKWISKELKHQQDGGDYIPQVSIGVGRDCRHSGPALSAWFSGGLEAAGAKAFDLGLCTTPSMFLSCSWQTGVDNINPWPLDGAVSLTASHLPSKWNGIKFFDVNSPTNIGENGIASLIDIASDPFYDSIIPYPITPENMRPTRPFLPEYSKFLQTTIKYLIKDDVYPLKGLKICVNAGNGAGGFLATTLGELGADTSSSIHLDPDGSFPNHIPNPEDKKAISATATAVLSGKADIGICLDTDADRVGLVDASGRLLNRNALIALVARIALRDQPGGVIVTDSATSTGLTKFIENSLGGKHIPYKKGYRHVIELGRNTPDCVAAMECSGHGAWKDNGWVDDGCYTAVRMVAELASMRRSQILRQQVQVQEGNSSELSPPETETKTVSLTDLLVGFEEPQESVELRLKAKGGSNNMVTVTAEAIEQFRQAALSAPGWTVEPVNYEGLRVKFSITPDGSSEPLEGWCMLRASLHEPILGLQIESEKKGGSILAAKILLEQMIHLKDVLDVQPLVTFASTL